MRAATAVVVLAGGQGVRMGGGKALRSYGPTTLAAHAVALARRWSPLVAMAVRSPEQVERLSGVSLLLDDPAIPGPAAGLASAFAFARRQGAALVLTLPCDTPRLPDDLLARLSAALDDGAKVAMAASRGRLHPTCALWRLDCAAGLPAYLARRSSLRGFGEVCGTRVVEWEAPAEDDPFANANTPAELAALQPRPLLSSQAA